MTPSERFVRRLCRGTLLILVVSVGALPRGQVRTSTDARAAPPGGAQAAKRYISHADAGPILEAFPGTLPPALQSKAAAAFPAWVSDRDGEIRARLDRGDEDSLVNLWLYGTSFTSFPPVRDSDMRARDTPLSAADVMEGRAIDLIEGIASPGVNERLMFARRFFETRGIDPAGPGGRAQVRRVLVEARARALAEYQRYDRIVQSADKLGDAGAAAAAGGTLFSDRGLSSDTSFLPNYAVERALASLASSGALAPRSVRRVAVIGPGLDFINKADGHDFYPQQTLQPFAVVDSLRRHGLAGAGSLRVLTFDISARVNHHLDNARALSEQGHAYVLNLPLASGEDWRDDFLAYWRRFGDQIGEPSDAAAPAGAAGVRVRAVRVRPEVVSSILPRDLNVVLERLEPLPADERFDLIVATNVFLYYDLFEQQLAMANVAAMLRPEGFLLANGAVFPVAPMKPRANVVQVEYSGRQFDRMFWYQRQP